MTFIKINGNSLGDYIQFEVDFYVLLDFGSVGSSVSSAINSIENMNSSTSKTILTDLLNSADELCLVITGSVVFQFASMTNGFIQDFSITVETVNFLLANGNGSSGMSAGFYLYWGSDVVSGLNSELQGVYTQYAGILSKLGISAPNLPSTGIYFGIFVDDSSLGFEFNFLGMYIKCAYQYSGSGSCNFNDSFFTGLIQDGQWVIKKASKFFDTTGSEIVSFSNDAKNFVSNQATAVKNLANTVATTAKKVGSAIKKAFHL